jgi:hypothetical protein
LDGCRINSIILNNLIQKVLYIFIWKTYLKCSPSVVKIKPQIIFRKTEENACRPNLVRTTSIVCKFKVHHRRLVDFTLFFPFCFKLQVLFIAALLSSFFFHSMLGKVFASLFNSWFCSTFCSLTGICFDRVFFHSWENDEDEKN